MIRVKIISPKSSWSLEGRGKPQKGGYVFVSDDGGSSSTKTRSLTDAEQRNIGDLLEVFGSLKGGSLGNKDPDEIKDFTDLFKKALEIQQNQNGGTSNEMSKKSGNEQVGIVPDRPLVVMSTNKDSTEMIIGTINKDGSGMTDVHRGTLTKEEVNKRYPSALKK